MVQNSVFQPVKKESLTSIWRDSFLCRFVLQQTESTFYFLITLIYLSIVFDFILMK